MGLSAALLLMLVSAPAFDGEDALPRSLQDEPPASTTILKMEAGVSVWIARPLGSFDGSFQVKNQPPTSRFQKSSGWSDFYRLGVGAGLRFDFFGEAIPHRAYPSRTWDLGLSVAFAFEQDWAQAFTDGAGASVKPENFRFITLGLGPRVVHYFNRNWQMDAGLVAGGVFYSSVDADYSNGLTPPVRGEFLAKSTKFAAEARVQGGWRYDRTAVTLGLCYRMMGGPRGGKDFSVTPGLLQSVLVDLGVEMRF